MGRRLRAMLLAGCATLATGACTSGSEDGANQTVASVVVTTIATSTTSSTITTSTTTTSPTTTVAASTTSPATTTTLEVGERADELLVVWTSGVLAVHDADTGALQRVVATVSRDATWAHAPVSSGDGTTYMGTSQEDSWYSCDTVQGNVIAVSPDGLIATIGVGGGPRISPDGRQLAFIRSSDCRPDPREPDFSFVSVSDTVVVRDLATDAERSWTFPGAFEDGSLALVVSSIVWYGDSLLALIKGRLVQLDPSDPNVPSTDGVAVSPTSGEPGDVYLLGARADGTVLAPVVVNGSIDRLMVLDPTTGREVGEIAAFEQPAWSTAVDRSGTRWATIIDGSLVVDGSEVILETPPPQTDMSTTDFEDSPAGVGW